MISMVGNCYQKVSLTKVSSSIDEGQKRLPPIVVEQKERQSSKVGLRSTIMLADLAGK